MSCPHLEKVPEITLPEERVCRKCLETGDTWVQLRTCQTCGETHCCDSSKNRHADKHFTNTGHPVIASAERNQKWMWCYEHKLYQEY